MDGGAWWATVHGVAKSRTRLSDLTHFPFFSLLKSICLIKFNPTLETPDHLQNS